MQANKKKTSYNITPSALSTFVTDHGLPSVQTSIKDESGYWGDAVATILGPQSNSLNARKAMYTYWHEDRGGVKS